jgi:predicted peroxiredoxin
MAKYLFVESRDPFEFTDVKHTWDLAVDLANKGDDVAMFLVQNAVLAARRSASVSTMSDLSAVRVFADDLSLEERAIEFDSVRDGVTVAGIDQLTDLIMEDGRKPIWM